MGDDAVPDTVERLKENANSQRPSGGGLGRPTHDLGLLLPLERKAVTKPYNPVRVAVIIPSFVAMGYKAQFIRAIDSIRLQDVLHPLYVVILDFGRGAAFDEDCQAAISNLRKFVPDVQLHTFREYHDNAVYEAYEYLPRYDLDVVVQMSDDVVLKPDGLYELTYGFYNSDVIIVDGSYNVIQKPENWLRWLWWFLTRRVTWKVFAYRNSAMAQILKEMAP